MTLRRGQVALYLIAILVAICMLTMMCVGIYVSVSAKNTVMNAGDAAALAVAKYQGELLNRIGQMNIDHLNAALKNDVEECDAIMERQLRCCFLEPLEGIAIGNEMAKANGAEQNDKLEKVLRQHALDVRNYYAANPDLYPAPWEGAWEEYAAALETAIGTGIWAGPDNINFVDAASNHLLLNQQFYNAILGECWCWFKFNALTALNTYSSFHWWDPLPTADDETRLRRCVNSEVYSLNLQQCTGSALDMLGADLIQRLTGATKLEIAASYMITNKMQTWMYYDTADAWHRWWEISPDGGGDDPPFPVVGYVKPEYDVRGCAALCRVCKTTDDLVTDGRENKFSWTAAAKPFGTVDNDEGEIDVVTAIKDLSDRSFVTPAFTDVRLVPIDTVGGRDLSTADADWMVHVHDHLPVYLLRGPLAVAANGCAYCGALVIWERASFRQTGQRWLRANGKTCVRPTSPGGSHGGTAHAH